MEEATPAESGAPEGSSGEVVGAGEASAGGGNAPAAGGDARVDGGGGLEAAPEGSAGESAASAAFRILNREFRDQKHAEEVLGSEIGAKRGLQRQNADLAKRVERYEALIEQLQGGSLRAGGSGATGQVAEQGRSEEPESFAEHLAKSGELDYFNKLAQNPEIGVAGAIYEALKQKDSWDQKHLGKQFEDRFSQIEQMVQGSEQRRTAEAAMARTFTAAKSLVSEFPELDDGNHSEAAEEAQETILGLLQSIPQGPQWLLHNPEQALRWAANEYRRTNGTPVFAQPPGTSESPSARVAAAAERRSAGGESLDGNGVPRTRQGEAKPSTLADKWREDSNRLKGREATSPSGRRLGFPA